MATDGPELTFRSEAIAIDRLAVLGRIWGHVGYLHPALHGGDAAARWDRAFVAAVPLALQAEDDPAYARVVSDLLGTMGDPATRVIDAQAANWQSVQPVLAERDGVLVVDLRDPATAPSTFTASPWPGLAERVKSSHAVVFDLRQTALSAAQDDSISWVFHAADVSGALGSRGLPGPSQRARGYDGFPAEGGSTSGGYRPLFEVVPPLPVDCYGPSPESSGYAEHRPFAVFLVNAHSPIPDCAAALSLAGLGAIVAEGATGLPGHPFAEIEIADGRVARLRLAEVLCADGSPWSCADWVVERDGLEAAVEIARSRKTLRLAAPTQAGPLPTPQVPAYPEGDLPSLAWRVLAVAKVYMVFELFFPYRSLMTKDWSDEYRIALAAVLATGDTDAYRVAIARLLCGTADSHVALRGAAVPAAFGSATPPLEIRFVEGRPIVTAHFDGAPSPVRIGDEITAIEGRPVAERIRVLSELIPASTLQSHHALIARHLLGGDAESTVRVTLDGPDGPREMDLERGSAQLAAPRHARGGPTYRMLDERFGYADLARLEREEVDAMFAALGGAEAIVFDMRGYPRGTAWSLAARLTDRRRVAAARFERPGVRGWHWASDDCGEKRSTTSFLQYLPDPVAPTYRGRTLMLIDERAISQSEHTGLFLRAAAGTRFVGTPTTGANGDVTWFGLPGGLRVTFSGQGVRWPDGTALQREGLQPDVQMAPTIAGIRAGRDEVLERALEWLRDPERSAG